MKKDHKLLFEFLTHLQKLDAMQGVGIFRLLNIPLIDPEGEPIPEEQVFQTLCRTFEELSRKQKRDLIKLVKQAVE